MLKTKEHYDLIDMFEKEMKGLCRFDKESKSDWSRGIIYQHKERQYRTFEKTNQMPAILLAEFKRKLGEVK